jgi:hypothetical protein
MLVYIIFGSIPIGYHTPILPESASFRSLWEIFVRPFFYSLSRVVRAVGGVGFEVWFGVSEVLGVVRLWFYNVTFEIKLICVLMVIAPWFCVDRPGFWGWLLVTATLCTECMGCYTRLCFLPWVYTLVLVREARWWWIKGRLILTILRA